jgi:two-component system sensor histidine kinase PilS (NtrC family)
MNRALTFGERIRRPGHPGEWASLRLLNSYRLFVALVLLIGFFVTAAGPEFGRDAPRIFYAFASTYLVLGLAFALLLRLRRPGAMTQAYLQFYTDVVALAGATFASGGVDSGLGILLIVPVAGAGLLLTMREALLYAALATLMLLTSEMVRHLQLGAVASDYPQAALLGAVLFAAALLAGLFARRSEQSAELARQRSQDVRRLAELNERIIQQMESGILVVAPDGTITLANASTRQLLGRGEDLVGEPLDQASPALHRALEHWREAPDDAQPPVQHDAGAARRLQPQFTSLGEQGTLVSLEDAAFIEEQLQQLKLASLGRLSASIAHEIRNPLGAISHSAQLLAESQTLDAGDRRLLEIQLQHCRRVNGIVENILQLSRRRSGDPSSVELVDWLESFAAEFRGVHDLGTDRLAVASETSRLLVRFDTEHLRQVVGNLCENSLTHGRTEDGAPVAIRLRAGQKEDDAYLEVRDDGVPIAAERVEEIFEPFFTTSHAGTGLGLFLARALCETNGAHLRYMGTEEGNCFRILLQAEGETAHA